MNRRQSSYIVEWGKNLAIVFLALSAVYLISQSTLYDGFGMLTRSRQEQLKTSQTGPDITVGRHVSLQPIRLAVNNETGRYGVQYDQQTVDLLFETKLGSLLREALEAVSDPVSTTEAQWKSVLSGKDTWIYYDLLTTMPLSDLGGWLGSEKKDSILTGTARRFLLADSQGKVVLYFRDETDGQYYYCVLSETEEDQFHATASEFEPNGAVFAFERPEFYGTLKYDVMILPDVPNMNRYEAENPLEHLQEGEQEIILRALQFNPHPVSSYRSADALVILEGDDQLRILDNGTVEFQSQETEQIRYPIRSNDLESWVEATQKLFMDVVADRCGEAVPYLVDVNTRSDGSVEISYGYRLNGAPVQIFPQGYAAQFIIQNDSIRHFTIHVRKYTSTDEKVVILPEKQAAAVVKVLGQEGKELLLVYPDSGGTLRISASWVTHE